VGKNAIQKIIEKQMILGQIDIPNSPIDLQSLDEIRQLLLR